MSLKCVIFDCDGVLVDSETIATRVLLTMSREHGLEISLEEWIKNFKGISMDECFLQIEKAINKKLPEHFEKDFRKRSFEAFRNEIKPVEGVREFIESLAVPICVASSGPQEKIRLNLTTTGLIHFFDDNIFSCYDINSWKPDPDIYLHAANKMGYKVEDCIVIEDSRPGVISGKSGGFKVYGYVHDGNAEELAKEGAVIFRSYAELTNLLEAEALI